MYRNTTKFATMTVALGGTGGSGGDGGFGGGAGDAGGGGGVGPGRMLTATELASSQGRAGMEITMSMEARPVRGRVMSWSVRQGPSVALLLSAGWAVTVVFAR